MQQQSGRDEPRRDIRRLLARGRSLHQAGRLDEAERCCRQVLRSEPGNVDAAYLLGLIALQAGRAGEAVELLGSAAEAAPAAVACQHALGNALRAAGRLEEAVDALDRAVALAPHAAQIHNDRGNALQDRGGFEEAIAAFDRVIELVPDAPEPHYNRGNALRRLEREEEAVESFDRAIARKSGYAKAHNNRGNALRALGRLEEALAAYDRAIDADPGFAPAHNNRATALQELGDLDAAYASAVRATELDPAYAEAYANAANVHEFREGDPLLEHMERLRERGGLAGAQAPHLCFALGKAYDDLGEPDRAFACWAEGNRAKAEQMGYDVDGEVAFLETLERCFDERLLQNLHRQRAAAPQPVFIVGMPRSGTTLVEQILGSHPEVYAAGELPDFEKAVGEVAGPTEDGAALEAWTARLTAENCGGIAEVYLQRLRARAPWAARVTDKMPGNFRLLGLIHLAVPEARIIHCRRDPMDTCLSCYTKIFEKGHGYSYRLTDLGRLYRAYDRLMRHWRRLLADDVLLEVDYEDVVADVEPAVRRLLAHCGLAWDDACLRFFEARRAVRTASLAQVRRPLYSSAVGRWRRYERHLRPLREALGPLAPTD